MTTRLRKCIALLVRIIVTSLLFWNPERLGSKTPLAVTAPRESGWALCSVHLMMWASSSVENALHLLFLHWSNLKSPNRTATFRRNNQFFFEYLIAIQVTISYSFSSCLRLCVMHRRDM